MILRRVMRRKSTEVLEEHDSMKQTVSFTTLRPEEGSDMLLRNLNGLHCDFMYPKVELFIATFVRILNLEC
jgi:hypothetical protein